VLEETDIVIYCAFVGKYNTKCDDCSE